jgi:hypothetical protein
MFTSG